MLRRILARTHIAYLAWVTRRGDIGYPEHIAPTDFQQLWQPSLLVLARANDRVAQFALGLHGDDTGWLRRSAEQGFVLAQWALARRLARPDRKRNVDQNLDEALEWMRLAAEQDDPRALSDLGWMYKLGVSVEASREAGERWHGQARTRGHQPESDEFWWLEILEERRREIERAERAVDSVPFEPEPVPPDATPDKQREIRLRNVRRAFER